MTNELPEGYSLHLLDAKSALQNATELTLLLNLIPLVTYSVADMLALKRGEREFHYKWALSHWIAHNNLPVATVLGYYRTSDGGPDYPHDSIYVSELAVAIEHQRKGLAKALLTAFFLHSRKLAQTVIPEEPLRFTVQTNAAVWNQHVQRLYQSFGFRKRGTKKYDNRTDWIMEVTDEELTI